MTQLLFAEDELIPWKSEWKDLPEYDIQDLAPQFSILIHFSCAADVEDFGALIGQPIQANQNSRQLQSLWFPEQEIGRIVNKRYIQGRR